MNKRTYSYNAGGYAVDSNGGFQSLKSEETSVLLHRKKLLQANLWRNRKVKPEQIQKGIRPAEQSAELDKETVKTMKAIERINNELKSRKGKEQ